MASTTQVVPEIRRGRLFAAACAGLAMFGIVIVLLGTLFGFPQMAERLHVDIVRLGALASLMLTGVWGTTVMLGPIIDRFGNKVVLVGSSFIVAASLVAFATAESFALAAVVCVVLGVGGAGLNMSTNALVSDLYDETRGSMLNYLGMFFSVGALGLPLTMAQLSSVFTIPQMIVGAAVLAALCGIVFLVLPFPQAKEAHGFSIAESLKVVRYPGVILFAVLLFFQTANEQAMSTFTPKWLSAAGAAPQIAVYILAVYQAGMFLGRITAGAVLRKLPKLTVVAVTAMIATVGCALLWLGGTPGLKTVGVGLIGLSFAPIYPTVLAEAGDRYRRFAGSVFGLLFSVALVGGIVAPSLIGYLSSRFGMLSGPIVPTVGSVIIALLALAAMRQPKAS